MKEVGPPSRAVPTTATARGVTQDDSTGPRRGEVADYQLDLDQYRLLLAQNARDAGMGAAEANDADWCDQAFDWIEARPAGSVLTADDVRDAVGASRAAGPVFARARRAGLIEATGGIATSRAVTRHAGIARIWRRT